MIASSWENTVNHGRVSPGHELRQPDRQDRTSVLWADMQRPAYDPYPQMMRQFRTVPEPGVLPSLGAGILLLRWLARRRGGVR
jgi:hypothetical protein